MKRLTLAIILGASSISALYPTASLAVTTTRPTCASVPEVCTLAGAAKRSGIWAGVAMNVNPPDPTKATVAANFNSITIENAMKWDSIQNPDGTFNFGPADDEVNWAAAHNLRVRGHTLLFHRPPLIPWARGAIERAPDPQAKARQLIKDLIDNVVGHFKGRVATWDVVNEPLGLFAPPTAQQVCPWGNGWDVNDLCILTQRNFFYTTLGETYIDEAFKLARAADPNAKLFLNELLWNPRVGDTKADALLALVKRLKDRGVPIDGVGLELHGTWGVTEPMFPGTADEFKRNSPTMSYLVDYIKRLGNLGVRVEFTEVDISTDQVRVALNSILKRPYKDITLSEMLATQAKIYGRVGRSCAAAPACSGVTVWGLTDPETWNAANGPWTDFRPLLFDENFQPKSSYFTLRDGLLDRCPKTGTQPAVCSIPWTSPPAPTVTWTTNRSKGSVTASFVALGNASSYSIRARSGTSTVTGSCSLSTAPTKSVCSITPGKGRWSVTVTPSNNWSDGAARSKTVTL